MKAAEHTPGPFYLVKYRTNVSEHEDGHGYSFDEVVEVWSQEEFDLCDDPEQFQNLEILSREVPPKYAVAPELLDALVDLHDQLECFGMDTSKMPSLKRSKDAIAKARGAA